MQLNRAAESAGCLLHLLLVPKSPASIGIDIQGYNPGIETAQWEPVIHKKTTKASSRQETNLAQCTGRKVDTFMAKKGLCWPNIKGIGLFSSAFSTETH
ncbi:MAG: hypothetical protein SVY10_20990 [Thermodesulfobacteriota bacterium]|nr:hypothetical protein [Thermodesulfobacteriota bacterium]